MDWKQMSDDDRLQWVVAVIHEAAKDGVAPTARKFAAGKPEGMPSVPTLMQGLGLSWSEMIEASGLRAPTTVRQWDSQRWYSISESERMEAVCGLLREMRADRGKLPSAKYWDDNRPSWVPQSRTVMAQFKMVWSKIQAAAGIDVDSIEIEKLANNRSVEPSTLAVAEPVTKRFYHWARRCWVVAELAEVR